MPPPANCGARVEPWRARPVPFCRYGFLPPPRTSPRVLVAAVPCRAAASWATTTWWISGTLTLASKISGGSTAPVLADTGVDAPALAALGFAVRVVPLEDAGLISPHSSLGTWL